MTKTNRQKLPALDSSGKVKNPDLSTIGENNYTSTVLKYSGLAIKYPQLKTKDKTIVGAINEVQESGGSSSGTKMEAGYGIYLSNKDTKINAQVGRRLKNDKHVLEIKPASRWFTGTREWIKTSQKKDGQYVYKSESGTYNAVKGYSLCDLWCEGYESLTVHVKQDDIDKNCAYIILGKPNISIDLHDSSTYQISYKGKDLSDYVSYTYEGLDPAVNNFIQIAYVKESRLKITNNTGDWWDFEVFPYIGKDLEYSTIQCSDSNAYISSCRFALTDVSGIIIYASNAASNGGTGNLYIGNIDSEVSESDYFISMPAVIDPSSVDINYPSFARGDHYIDAILHCTSESYSSYISAKIKYKFPDEYMHGRAYFYAVPSKPASSYDTGEIFNDYRYNHATGEYSHAEGSLTHSNGTYSHAEGYCSVASGEGSHAEGDSTHATGDYSHTEGYDTCANNEYAHAEGYRTWSEGFATHAEGRDTYATGDYSHAEGFGTDTNSECIYTYTEGIASHAEGLSGQVINGTSNGLVVGGHVEGIPAFKFELYNDTKTYNTGDYVFLYIQDRSAIYMNSQFVAYRAIQDGITGVLPTEDTTKWKEYKPISSFYTVVCDDSVSPMVYTHNTVNSGHGGHAEGIATYNAGEGGHVEGGLYIDSTVYGTYNTGYAGHAEGMGTKNKGNGGHAEGGHSTVLGNYAHAEGLKTYATGVASHAEGFGTSATGDYQHVIGKFNKLDANKAFILGNGTGQQRHDALTIDWSGNIVTEGDITTGVTLSTSAQTLGAAINEIIQRLNNAGI